MKRIAILLCSLSLSVVVNAQSFGTWDLVWGDSAAKVDQKLSTRDIPDLKKNVVSADKVEYTMHTKYDDKAAKITLVFYKDQLFRFVVSFKYLGIGEMDKGFTDEVTTLTKNYGNPEVSLKRFWQLDDNNDLVCEKILKTQEVRLTFNNLTIDTLYLKSVF